MTLYLDTSSIVKRYVDEEGAANVHQLLSEATVLVSSAIAYAETRAVFARLHREKRIASPRLSAVRRDFEEDWAVFFVIEVNEGLARSAGDLAEAHGLGGCDGIHLASFAEVLARAGEEDVHFSSFDDRLSRAARKLG